MSRTLCYKKKVQNKQRFLNLIEILLKMFPNVSQVYKLSIIIIWTQEHLVVETEQSHWKAM